MFLSVYSYALMDPNITFVNSPIWAIFREKLVYFGYYQRPLSTAVYILLIGLLFLFHSLLLKKKQNISPVKLSFLIGGILLLAYPFLSHDFFNYLFDEKILTFYHQNPYVHKALDFPADNWTRFMHWTHRTYPYGPTFLIVMLPASIVSFGKFLLSFIFGKLTFVILYIFSVHLLVKIDKNKALFFAANPLILIEGLMNAHNDFIAAAFSIFGIYYLAKKTNLLAGIFFIFSAGIKFITAPILVLLSNHPKKNLIAAFGIFAAVLYASVKMEIQPWYFLSLFALYPLMSGFIADLSLLFAGLLFSYYPYVLYGDWGDPKNIVLKHSVIIVSALLNAVWLAKKCKFIKITK